MSYCQRCYVYVLSSLIEQTPPQNIKQKSKLEDDILSSPAENEFVSDTFQADTLNDEDLKKEMQQLRVEDDKKEAGN